MLSLSQHVRKPASCRTMKRPAAVGVANKAVTTPTKKRPRAGAASPKAVPKTSPQPRGEKATAKTKPGKVKSADIRDRCFKSHPRKGPYQKLIQLLCFHSCTHACIRCSMCFWGLVGLAGCFPLGLRNTPAQLGSLMA